MAFQRVISTVEMVVRWQANSAPWTNTFYAYFGGAYTQQDLDDLAVVVDAWVDNGLKTLLSNAAQYDGVSIRGLDAINDYEAFNNDGAGQCGVASSPLPSNVAFAISRRSAKTGRSARGRVFIGGIPVTQQLANENYISSTYADSLLVPLNELRNQLYTNGGWTEVVVSRYSEGVKRDEAVTFPVTQYLYTDTILDTYRTRMPTTS